MASDPFAAAIASVLSGLSYQVQETTLPKQRDYDPSQPTVYVCPDAKPTIFWIAFGTRACRQAYDIAYVYPNKLDPSLANNNVWQFKQDVIDQFMGLNDTLETAGAFNSTAADVTDYRKDLLKEGFTLSHIRILVDYLPG